MTRCHPGLVANAVPSGGQPAGWYQWKAHCFEAPNMLLVLPFSLQRPQKIISHKREEWSPRLLFTQRKPRQR